MNVDKKLVGNALWGRLQSGNDEYGGSSFKRTFRSIAGEVLEELLDVVGWTAVAWLTKTKPGALSISKKDLDAFIDYLMSEKGVHSDDEYLQAMLQLSVICLTAWAEFSTQWIMEPKRKKSVVDKASEMAEKASKDCRRILQSIGHEPDDREMQELLLGAMRPTLIEFIQDRIGTVLGVVVESTSSASDED